MKILKALNFTKKSFPAKTSLVNVSISEEDSRFLHIYQLSFYRKT